MGYTKICLKNSVGQIVMVGGIMFLAMKGEWLCIWGKIRKRGLSDEGERKSGKIGILFGAGYGY